MNQSMLCQTLPIFLLEQNDEALDSFYTSLGFKKIYFKIKKKYIYM